MAISLEQSQTLLPAEFYGRAEACMALARCLVTMPTACVRYQHELRNRALFVSKYQVVDLTQDQEATVLRSWPVAAVTKVRLESTSSRGVLVGMDTESPILGALRDLRLSVEFELGEPLEFLGSEAAALRPGPGTGDPLGAAAFILAVTQLLSESSQVEVSWPT